MAESVFAAPRLSAGGGLISLRECRPLRRGWRGPSLRWSRVPFAGDPAQTPLCQLPKPLLWLRYLGMPTVSVVAMPPTTLPPLRSLQAWLREVRKVPSLPPLSIADPPKHLGDKQRLKSPIKPERPFGLTALKIQDVLRHPLVLNPQHKGMIKRMLSPFPNRRRATGWLLRPQPLARPHASLPRFSTPVPAGPPLYAQKKWPIDWPKQVPQAPPWDPEWDRPDVRIDLTPDLSERAMRELLKQVGKAVKAGKLRLALKLTEKILAQRAEHRTALRTRARLLVWLKRLKDARLAYDDLFSLVPGDVPGYRGMGELELVAGRYEEALRWFRLYLTYHPDDLQAWRGLARAAAKLKRKKIARAAYKKVLVAFPKDREAKKYIEERKHARYGIFFNMEHRFFHSGRVGQTFEPKAGLRFFDRLLVMIGTQIDLRHFPGATVGELLLYGEGTYVSKRWPGFVARMLVGGSPIFKYYPQFLFDADAATPLPWLTWPKIKLLTGYRFYLFPTRQAHLLMPGISLSLFKFGAQVRYYLNLSQLIWSSQTQVQHAIFFQVEWQPLWWLVLRTGVGFGNFADYLLNSFQIPSKGPAAGTDTYDERTFAVNLGAQFELPKNQFLIVVYRFYTESVTLYPGDPPIKQTFFHAITLGYRLYLE